MGDNLAKLTQVSHSAMEVISSAGPHSSPWMIFVVSAGAFSAYVAVRSVFSRDFRQWLLGNGIGVFTLSLSMVSGFLSGAGMITSLSTLTSNLCATCRGLMQAGNLLTGGVNTLQATANTTLAATQTVLLPTLDPSRAIDMSGEQLLATGINASIRMVEGGIQASEQVGQIYNELTTQVVATSSPALAAGRQIAYLIGGFRGGAVFWAGGIAVLAIIGAEFGFWYYQRRRRQGY
jgi:hypothetical protein